MYAYFTDISQGSVETHLRCGGIYNNHIIANCLQSVSVISAWYPSQEFAEDTDRNRNRKNFENWSTIGEAIDKSKVAHFFGSPCISVWQILLSQILTVYIHIAYSLRHLGY